MSTKKKTEGILYRDKIWIKKEIFSRDVKLILHHRPQTAYFDFKWTSPAKIPLCVSVKKCNSTFNHCNISV